MQPVHSFLCGCADLRTGTQILLWFGAVLASSSALFSIENGYGIAILISGIITGIHVIGIYGVEKERPIYLRPYLVLQVIFIVAIIIFFTYAAITVGLGKVLGSPIALLPLPFFRPPNDLRIAISAFFSLLALGFLFHCFIAVLSYHKKLGEEIHRPVPDLRFFPSYAQ